MTSLILITLLRSQLPSASSLKPCQALSSILSNFPLLPVLPEEYTQQVLSSDATVTDLYLLSALQQTRLTKDADEIGAIKHANEISSRAHEVMMRVLGMAVKGKIQAETEWLIEKEAEAEAIFVALFHLAEENGQFVPEISE